MNIDPGLFTSDFIKSGLTEIAANFHFLRPEWFYALLPLSLLFALLRYRQSHHSNWEKVIDQHLLQRLLDRPQPVRKSPLILLLLAWLVAVLALAGPAWRKTQQPVYEREDAVVVILDLTKSMLATDVKPNRLVRAKRKLVDMLELREEGTTALIVFAGDAHTVTPLTDDTNAIKAMIPVLAPAILPSRGSQLTPALERAIELFHDAGAASGRILIITDEVRDLAVAQRFVRQYRNAYPVSVMSVGTRDGAPVLRRIQAPSSGFLKDQAGNLVLPKLDEQRLQDFAEFAGGRYSPMTLTDEDLVYLLAEQPLVTEINPYAELDRNFDTWYEEGPWLLLFLLPLAALAFRRGWVWSLALLVILPRGEAMALGWDDLWSSKDEQGMVALAEGRPVEAAALFENQAWQASASYRGELFEAAANQFGSIKTLDGQYNLGNALAQQGRLEEAIEAYDKALAYDPDNEDAQFNKSLIEQILAQKQQEESAAGEAGDASEEGEAGEVGEAGDAGEEKTTRKEDEAEEMNEAQQAQAGKSQEEQEEAQGAQKGEQEEDPADAQGQASEADPLVEEEQRALRQWLRRVPDDPGGLLQRKFKWQYDEHLREGRITDHDTDKDW